jgi:hypothetical protein
MVHIRLQCVRDILVADGTFQISRNNHWHLTVCPTVTPRFVFWRRSKLCQLHVRGSADKSLARPGRKQATATKLGIYTQEVTACFTLPSVSQPSAAWRSH